MNFQEVDIIQIKRQWIRWSKVISTITPHLYGFLRSKGLRSLLSFQVIAPYLAVLLVGSCLKVQNVKLVQKLD